ncbi:unnamed protein product [Effrenium voratum]|nr:unnamed protein product [Effrenium voratum]
MGSGGSTVETKDVVKDHHEMFDAFTRQDWKEVARHIDSQVNAEALATLGEQNFQNCVRLSIGAIAHTHESPKDVEEAAEILRRGVFLAKWPFTKVAYLVTDHPKQTEVLCAALAPPGTDTCAAVDRLVDGIDGSAKILRPVVLHFAKRCLDEKLDDKARRLLECAKEVLDGTPAEELKSLQADASEVKLGPVEDHHAMWNAYVSKDWKEVARHIDSQVSAEALAALGEQNFANCVRMSLAAISNTIDSPQDVEEALVVLRRGLSISGWPRGRAGGLLVEFRQSGRVLEALYLPPGTSTSEAVDGLSESEFDGESGALVLALTRRCMAEGLDTKALGLLDKYLKLHKPANPYDSGDLLALWYALRWRQQKREPSYKGKVAVVIFNKAHVSILKDSGLCDLGVTCWDEKTFRSETVPEVQRDWKIFSDAMSFLTDGALALDTVLVEDCAETMPPAAEPTWDAKYKRCSAGGDWCHQDVMMKLEEWEERYKCRDGSDVVAFHILWPAGKDPEKKVDVVSGGMLADTTSASAYKNRPVFIDEGYVWSHHHRVFWMFHEIHHKYEEFFKDQLDFAQLIKKTDHPMFQRDLWIEEFKGENEKFPGPHWKGDTEFNWYVQAITLRLTKVTEPFSFQDAWKSWWGGRKKEKEGFYFDFAAQHNQMYQAYVAQDWGKVIRFIDQLKPMALERLGDHNFRNAVRFACDALVQNGEELAGPVLDAFRKGMAALQYDGARGAELVNGAAYADELLRLYCA